MTTTRTHAELLLTDRQGRVLLTPGPAGPDLPRGPVPFNQTPHTAARRHAEAATGLAQLAPGRMLATDWRPDTALSVVTYDHPPLTDTQVAALVVEDGRRGAPVLLAPADLETRAPGAAGRVLALLHARVEGRTVELEHGLPRTPGLLDIHRVLARSSAPVPAAWSPIDHGGPITDVRGWLFHPAGLVLVSHDLETGRTTLPGGGLDTGDADDPEAALGRICALTVHLFVKDAEVIGFRGPSARLAAFLPGQALAMPAGTRLLRLLVTPDQVLDLCAGQVCRAELEAACRSVDLEGAAQMPRRRSVVDVPAEGMPW
ncbi:hypothetical protein [Kitasatospora sp. NPDC058046]|uniref:hypothetical protein n=1 Tax=Kitasatospora sp. NPDC058046 TaxID=3346312 RepID=UPI0036DCDF4F